MLCQTIFTDLSRLFSIKLDARRRSQAILQALARAFSWADILESGQIKSISELARTLDVDGSYVARILKLTTLAPDIVEALINGEEPNGLSLAKLTQTFPEDWAEQRRQFGFVID